MSNRKKHALLGAIFGFRAYVIAKQIQKEEIVWNNAVGCGILGAGIAILPDILDPPISPNHRALAHSWVAGGAILQITSKIWENNSLSSEQKAAMTAVASAYLSHLAEDSSTPAGLPAL